MNPALAPAMSGRWSLAAARGAALSALVLIGVVLFGTLAGQQLMAAASPERAVASYYQALASGDAATAWSLASYGRGPLLSARALRAMLAEPANRDYGDVQILGSRRAGPGAYLVDVAYRRGGVSYAAEASVLAAGTRWAALPAWRVTVAPARLVLAGSTAAGALTVDGVPVSAAAAAAGLAVIPGRHVVVETASPVSALQRLAVEADGSVVASLSPAVPVPLQAQASSLLEAAFAGCERSADLRPGGCPISTYRMGDSVAGVTWAPVGDQLAGAAFAVGRDPLTISVSGDWRMRVGYDYSYAGLEDEPGHRDAEESGRWTAVLKKGPAGFQLLSFEGA